MSLFKHFGQRHEIESMMMRSKHDNSCQFCSYSESCRPGMAESFWPPQPSFEPIGCANCFVYSWDQLEDMSTLKSCKQCKVMQYCSKE